MGRKVARRELLGGMIVGAVGLGAATAGAATQVARQAPADGGRRRNGGEDLAVGPDYPYYDSDRVRQVVRVSHFDLAAVRELVERQPSLAKAAVDWGFGDFETALGAASHTGNREIAELLIGHGARPDLFTAAMLGQLDVVRAWIEARPGIQSVLGPHSISLLSHARLGGDRAAAVHDYLLEVGGADPRPGALLPAEALATYFGTYRFGPGERDLFSAREIREELWIERPEGALRGLIWLEGSTFCVMGAESVRVVFELRDGLPVAFTVHDPAPVLRAERVA